jgi:hypothetical protein
MSHEHAVAPALVVWSIAVLSCACTRVESESAADPSHERPAPELIVESAPASAHEFSGTPVLLRCPATHEHGCTAVFRVPPMGGEAELFTLEHGIVNDMAVLDEELLFASQVSFSTLVAYPKRARDAAARYKAQRLLDASGSRIHRMSLAGGMIVVGLEQDLIAVPLDGSPRTVLATTTAAFFVQTDGHSVVWSEDRGHEQAGRIMQVPIGGGMPRVVIDGEDRPQDVAIDSSGVYWINWGNGYYDPPGQVRALATGEQEPRTLATDQRAPRVIATDDESVYWVVDGPGGRALRKVGKHGGEVIELVPRTGREGMRRNEDAVRLFGDHVYFNSGDAVWQVGVDGDAPMAIAKVKNDKADVVTFAIDESGLYVAAQIHDPHEHERYDH